MSTVRFMQKIVQFDTKKQDIVHYGSQSTSYQHTIITTIAPKLLGNINEICSIPVLVFSCNYITDKI